MREAWFYICCVTFLVFAFIFDILLKWRSAKLMKLVTLFSPTVPIE